MGNIGFMSFKFYILHIFLDCCIISHNGMNSHILGSDYNAFHDFQLYHFLCMCFIVVSLSFLDNIFPRR